GLQEQLLRSAASEKRLPVFHWQEPDGHPTRDPEQLDDDTKQVALRIIFFTMSLLYPFLFRRAGKLAFTKANHHGKKNVYQKGPIENRARKTSLYKGQTEYSPPSGN